MPLWWKTARPFRLLPGGSSCGWEESVVGGTAVLEEEAPCGAEVTAQDRMASATLSALQGGERQLLPVCGSERAGGHGFTGDSATHSGFT